MTGPRLMVCGHWSYCYIYEKQQVLDGLERVMVDFGPGCLACFSKKPKQKYALEIRERYGWEEPLYNPSLAPLVRPAQEPPSPADSEDVPGQG